MALKIIRHRVNTVSELRRLPLTWGVETDVRSRNGRLILTHDPHKTGESLESFLAEFRRGKRTGPLIMNPKEDGLEDGILAALKKHRVTNYFFLDLTLPTLVRLSVRRNVRKIALRVSEYEPAASALKFKGRVDWIWLDCFTGKPPAPAVVKSLRRNFKVCLVSPELQGYAPASIVSFLKLRPWLDAVCTKHPDLWA